MERVLKPAYGHEDEVKTLFGEYQELLLAGDPAIRAYLDIQHYDEEAEHLEEKYGRPDGRLYLLYCDGALAGCVGLRKMSGTDCEIKRLYVRSGFRGERLGEYLMRSILQEAKDMGYAMAYLDTMPYLQAAIALYKKLGFYEISCYNNSPIESTIFMRREL